MLLFSTNNSNFGGIAKVFVLIGGLIVGLFRMCGSKMDDVGRLANRGDDFYHGSQLTDAARSARRGTGAIEDLYSISDEVASTRIRDFEVIYMDDLEPSSDILKSFEGTKGLSPSMRLQMMQTELLPVSVRRVLSEPGGEELYALMMGKPLSVHEANALRKLFNIPFEKTDDALDDFVFIKRSVKNTEGESLDEANKRLFDEMTETRKGLKNVDLRTTRGTDNYQRMSESMREPALKGKRVLIENHLDLELERELIRFGLRHIHHLHSYAQLFKKEASILEVWMYSPMSDSLFMSHYEVSKQEMKSMRTMMKQMAKKNGFRIITSFEELKIKEANWLDGKISPKVGICNYDKTQDLIYLFLEHNTSILSIKDYDPFVLNESTDSMGIAFRPLMTAMKRIELKKEYSVTDVLEDIATRYSEEIEKNSKGKRRSLITIRFAAGGKLMEVTYDAADDAAKE
jgi:hypothetical protein